MTAENGHIDLDEPPRGPDGSNESRRKPVHSVQRMALYLVATFVLGVALGGIGVAELQDYREQRAKSTTAELVAIVGSSGGGGGGNGIVHLNAQLMVINASPAPITVHVVGAEEPGILVRQAGQPELLNPGGKGSISVQVTVECRTAIPILLPMRFSVQTAGQRTREISYPVALEGSAWHDGVNMLCAAFPAATR